jgi:hypothetical protein
VVRRRADEPVGERAGHWAVDAVTRAPTLAATSPPTEPAPPHIEPGERAALGRAARAAVSRSAHAEQASVGADRDPVALLQQQAGSRVPDLVPIRYGRMMASPFAFFRGAALVMADDLARLPRTGLTVQLCGDAHLSNFGLFASPSDVWSSISMISTRRCPGPSSGM